VGILAQAGRSVESLLEELAAAGLAEGPPSARVSDYRGGALRDAEAAAPSQQQQPATAPAPVGAAPAASVAAARPPLDPAVYAPPSAAGLRQALTALCVLPLTSAVVHGRRARNSWLQHGFVSASPQAKMLASYCCDVIHGCCHANARNRTSGQATSEICQMSPSFMPLRKQDAMPTGGVALRGARHRQDETRARRRRQRRRSAA